jgi:PKD repeat protein
VDLQVTGADPSDRVQAYFYYPTTLTGRTEEKLRLLYFDGTRWAQVRSDGPSLPVKHTADAPTYGGYFDVTFSDTSVPRVTELSGTVFTFTESTPEITALSGPTGPLPLGSPATLAVEFVAVGTPDSHTVRFDWDDGTATTLTPVEDGFASATHVYDAAGVYTVRVQVTDAEGDAAVAPFEYVVVYDPVGGFVTGGGWILSPPGAYQLLPSVSGKATFGFVSKYKKGAQIPSGNTEFQFVAAELCFTSTAYQWLVVTGPKAQYKGVGVINEQGDYGFLLTAVDGQINGGGGVDRLRLKIWERATGVVVYDNAPSVSDDLDGSNSQPLGGGSVVIHR